MLASKSGLGMGLSDLAGADAMTALAQALINSQVQLSESALAEVLFIRLYGGAWGDNLVDYVLSLKPHQSYGSTKRFKESLASLALQDFFRGVNLNLGGK